MLGRPNLSEPWEGRYDCTGETLSGLPCRNKEIDGLGYCFHHVPDEMLEEAEEITGLRRCRHAGGCTNLAVEGTAPPCCAHHGAAAGGIQARAAAHNVIEARILDELTEIMGRGGERLLNPPKIGDPFAELLALASRIKELEMLCLEVVSTMTPRQWRYSNKYGEQARTEILMLERAQVRLERTLRGIVRLGIEDRMVGVEKRTLDLIERAMDQAVITGIRAASASGDELDGTRAAREVLNREIPVLMA